MAYRPDLTWDRPSPCLTCGGKRFVPIDYLRQYKIWRKKACPDCTPSVVMAQWPGGTAETF